MSDEIDSIETRVTHIETEVSSLPVSASCYYYNNDTSGVAIYGLSLSADVIYRPVLSNVDYAGIWPSYYGRSETANVGVYANNGNTALLGVGGYFKVQAKVVLSSNITAKLRVTTAFHEQGEALETWRNSSQLMEISCVAGTKYTFEVASIFQIPADRVIRVTIQNVDSLVGVSLSIFSYEVFVTKV